MSCFDANQEILNEIRESALDESEEQSCQGADSTPSSRTHSYDYLRVQEMFLQIVREWSKEGEAERRQSFGRLLEELVEIYPESSERSRTRVLVPGCGLFRLPFEVSSLGFETVANEMSYFMLFAGSFILNGCEREHNYRCYPYAHQLQNRPNYGDATTPVSFPDVDPKIGQDQSFQVLPGDMLDVCDSDLSADCVLSSFFLDSAHNVVDYVRKIHECLKTGGRWINIGPLNYSFEGIQSEVCISLSWEDLKEVIAGCGFKFAKEETGIDCAYQDGGSRTMECVRFKSIFFVCEKL